MSAVVVVALGLLGGVGAIARFALDGSVSARVGRDLLIGMVFGVALILVDVGKATISPALGYSAPYARYGFGEEMYGDSAAAFWAVLIVSVNAIDGALFPGAMVSGSGPTVFAIYDSPDAAREAAAALPGAIAVEPVPPGYGEVRAG